MPAPSAAAGIAGSDRPTTCLEAEPAAIAGGSRSLAGAAAALQDVRGRLRGATSPVVAAGALKGPAKEAFLTDGLGAQTGLDQAAQGLDQRRGRPVRARRPPRPRPGNLGPRPPPRRLGRGRPPPRGRDGYTPELRSAWNLKWGVLSPAGMRSTWRRCWWPGRPSGWPWPPSTRRPPPAGSPPPASTRGHPRPGLAAVPWRGRRHGGVPRAWRPRRPRRGRERGPGGGRRSRCGATRGNAAADAWSGAGGGGRGRDGDPSPGGRRRGAAPGGGLGSP